MVLMALASWWSTQHQGGGSPAGMAGKVNYSDEPVRLDLLTLDEREVYRVFTTKTIQWSMEREYRLVERLNEPFAGRLFTYSGLRIASVTIGMRLEAGFVDRFRSICSEHGIDIEYSQQGLAAD